MEIIIEEYGEALLALITAIPIIALFAEVLNYASSF